MNANLDRSMRQAGIVAAGKISPQPWRLAAAALAALAVLAPRVATAAGQSPPATSAPKSAAAEAQTYERCMGLARHAPQAARDLAERWRKQGGAHPADHCYAIALIGLKQYKDGAIRLEKLAQAMVHAPNELRAEVLDQASQAWLLAGDPPHAYGDSSSALLYAPGDPDLLLDRAEAAGEAGWFDKAVPDLDRVLKADPHRVEALVYRATAYRAMGKLDPAYADIEEAVQLAPDSAAALLERGNIRRLKGDVAGARSDWTRVVAMSPDGAAGLAAKANIAQLDAKPGSPPQH